MSRKAMQMALEALEDANDVARMEFGDEDYYSEAISALRQALETEQEPVAWLKTWSDGSLTVLKTKSHAFADHELEPLYTAPPKREWVGLTDEQVEDEWERITGHSIFGGDRSEGRAMYISPDEVIEFSRAIEAKLKEKNHG
jgi:hypothetical protein